MEHYTIIVPCYQPDENLLKVIEGLEENGFEDIVVVNDGSAENTLSFFETAKKHDSVTLLTHEVNKGKGRALKTAFSYVLESIPDSLGVICVDADNQHTIKDIKELHKQMQENPGAVYFGCRNFNDPNVPWRSSFGNKVTSFIFTYILRIPISDTQTGLRGIPREYLQYMIDTKGDRYEFETEMLFTIKTKNIPIKETTIETVYIGESNDTSHFHPIRDSWRIYKLILAYAFKRLFSFIKFAMSSFVSFLTDWGVYTTLLLFLSGRMEEKISLAIAVVSGKLLSSILNFFLNRKVVFKSKKGTGSTLVRYYILWACQTACSYGLITLLGFLFGSESVIVKIVLKPIVDVVLFLLSYKIQKNWVFGQKEKNS